MINSKQLYPDYEDGDYGPDDYQPIIKSFGSVAIQVDDNDYQGDTRVLYNDNEKGLGLLIFGWGSCSGCDALQAVSSHAELQELIDELEQSIKWFKNKKEALDYISNKDWAGEFCWHSDETKKFIELAKIYLSK